MNEISCGLCQDLIPLVKDGIASGDSVRAVERHLGTCPQCRALFDGTLPPAVDGDRVLGRLRRQLRLFCATVMMLGIFFGLSLTAGSNLFYNSLIMPCIGALGYGVFRRRAVYAVPGLLFVTHGLTNLLGLIRGAEHLDLPSLLLWTALYSLFALVGVAIAALLHYAFRREN